MPKFNVDVTAQATVTARVIVEANDKDDAWDKVVTMLEDDHDDSVVEHLTDPTNSAYNIDVDESDIEIAHVTAITA